MTDGNQEQTVPVILMIRQKQLLVICKNDELRETGSRFNEHIHRDGCWHPSVHTGSSFVFVVSITEQLIKVLDVCHTERRKKKK